VVRTSLAGKPLVQSAYQLLRQDKSMVVLLFAGGVCSALAFGLVVVPASVVHGAVLTERDGFVGLAVYAVALLLSTFVSTLFMGAVVAAAMIRADGGDPGISSAMAVAWSRRSPLLAWAAMSTVVGIAMRVLERFGAAAVVVRLFAGVAWAVATMFAVPVIMAEGTMPVQTVRRSAQILTSRFGTNVRATFRLGFQWTMAMLGALLVVGVGVALVAAGNRAGGVVLEVVGGLLVVTGVIAFFVISAVYAAVSVYLRTVLFRYATGRPTPGIDPSALPPMIGIAPA
jgi:Family of unknown function (DUF6159)